MTKHKIIIDTDPGIDDAMAIHFAFSHPDIEVIGLTTVFGNVHTTTATRNALALAEMAFYETTVAHGTDKPLVQPQNPPPEFIHGKEGFGEVILPPPTGQADPRSAAKYICDTINQTPGEITLCPIGPLTNIALALREDPGITERVKDVYIMGGAVKSDGNVNQWAEANIWNDPHAADEVFAADWPITLLGLDVTNQVRSTPAEFQGIEDASPILGGFLNKATQFYFEFNRHKHNLGSCALHDPSVIIGLLHPELYTCEKIPLKVICEGEQAGNTEPYSGSDRRPVNVCLGVNKEAFLDIFLETLGACDRAMVKRQQN